MKQSLPLAGMLCTALVFSTFALGGCAGMSRQDTGTAAGAVVGGVVGNALCGGILCTGAGAAAGGLLGHEVTKP